MEFSLAGRRALITGAGRGIGAAIAELFAEAGADLVVNALTDRHLGPLTERLAATYGRQVIGVSGDCTTAAGAEAVALTAEVKAGPIDILVNAVGDSIRAPFALDLKHPDVEPMSEEDIEAIINLNLMAAIHMSRRLAPQMLARGWGKVINISASRGVTRLPHLSLYASGKAAMNELTRSLAREWAGEGVQVNAIAPGMFPAPPGPGDPDLTSYLKLVPSGRFGRFREAGLLALYLASSASDYMTGQVIALDGGIGL